MQNTNLKDIINNALVNLDRIEKTFLFISGLLLGSALAYSVYLEDTYLVYKILWEKFLTQIPDQSEPLPAIASVVAALAGISIPVSISTVASHLKPYNDPFIAKLFKNEPLFKFQIINAPIIISISAILIFINCRQSVINILIILYLLYFLWKFYYFVHLILEYTINTDEIVFNKTCKEIDEILE